MRTTLHLVTARDFLAYAGIYRESRIREIERQLAALGEDVDSPQTASAWRRSRPRAVARDRSFSRFWDGQSCGSKSGARGSPGTASRRTRHS